MTQYKGKVCGYVNGRNSFGAYAGATKFVWSETSGPKVESGGDGRNSGLDALKACQLEEDWKACKAGIAVDPIAKADRCRSVSVDAYLNQHGVAI